MTRRYERTGKRLLILTALIASLCAAYAYGFYFRDKACMTDAKIAEYLRTKE